MKNKSMRSRQASMSPAEAPCVHKNDAADCKVVGSQTETSSAGKVGDALVYDLSRSEVSEHLRVNYIVSGYREGGNYRQCVESLFRRHNEV